MPANERQPTPGPWKFGIREDGSMWLSIGDPKFGPHYQGDVVCSHADAELIVSVPKLLAERQELRGRVAELEACTHCGGPDTSDKDCMCGGTGKRAVQTKGLDGCIQYWRKMHREVSVERDSLKEQFASHIRLHDAFCVESAEKLAELNRGCETLRYVVALLESNLKEARQENFDLERMADQFAQQITALKATIQRLELARKEVREGTYDLVPPSDEEEKSNA